MSCQNVVSRELLQSTIAERPGNGVVDPAELRHRLGVLAYINVGCLSVGSPRTPRPGIGDDDSGGLQATLSSIPSRELAGGERFNQPVGQMTTAPFRAFERRGNRFHDLGTDEKVPLRDIIRSRAMPSPNRKSRLQCVARHLLEDR